MDAGSELDALYATAPVYLPDAFAVAPLTSDLVCHIVWLVPISPVERGYIASHGWEAFEQILVDQDPDLLSLSRPSVPGVH